MEVYRLAVVVFQAYMDMSDDQLSVLAQWVTVCAQIVGTLVTAVLAWIAYKAFKRAEREFLLTRYPAIIMEEFRVLVMGNTLRLYGKACETVGIPTVVHKMNIEISDVWNKQHGLSYETLIDVFQTGQIFYRNVPSPEFALGEIDIAGLREIAACQTESKPIVVARFVVSYEYSVIGSTRLYCAESCATVHVDRSGKYSYDILMSDHNYEEKKKIND